MLCAVAVLGWGQGGTGPPNLAQAPPNSEALKYAYRHISGPQNALAALTTLPQIP